MAHDIMITLTCFLYSCVVLTYSLSIVQCDVTCSSNSPFYNTTFIIISGYLKKVPDVETLFCIKVDFNQEKDVMKVPEVVLESLIRGKDIPPLKRKSLLPDDVVSLELQMTHALQDFEPVLLSRQLICEGCKNPSVVPWNNQALLVFESRLQQRKLNYYWLNISDYPLKSNQYLGIDQYIPWKDSQCMSEGADARLVALTDEILYVVNENPVYHVALVILTKQENQIQVSTSYQIWPDKNPTYPHKNWSPFIYNNSLFLLQTIHPLHIVTLESSPKKDSYKAKTVSFTTSRSLRWKYGEVRGGSNPVSIGGNEYMGFFHSRYSIPFNSLGSCVFGAYTFTTYPTFRLTGLSKFPIYIDEFHQGPWFNKYFDYVVYPMSVYINFTEESVYLTVGYNDYTGHLLKFSLVSIIKSLVPIFD